MMRVEAERRPELIWRAEPWISGRSTFSIPARKRLILRIQCYASCVIDTRADRRIVLASQDQEFGNAGKTSAPLARRFQLPLFGSW